MPISLRDARTARLDRAWLELAYRQYLDDLSAGSTGLFPALIEEGHREHDLLAGWFLDERTTPFLLLRGEQPVGFAVVTRMPRASGSPLYRMTEFFVQPPFRGRGIGREAATMLFTRFAGDWLVTEQSRNDGAVRFWRSVLRQYTSGRYLESRGDGEIRHTFTSSGSAPVRRPGES